MVVRSYLVKQPDLNFYVRQVKVASVAGSLVLLK